jgi:uncharacterized protein involved in response to NO
MRLMKTLPLTSDEQLHAKTAATRKREEALARIVMLFISTGLAFMLLPGTFLGVWNLLSISNKHAADSISAAWIQAHGHAQVFGWIGTFILGIGFYSIPRVRNAQPFALWEAWSCWLLWTVGVTARWAAGVYQWHWRAILPISASLELLAFLIFFRAVSTHKPASPSQERSKLETWVFVVVAGTLGLLGTLAANLGGCIWAAVHGSSPAFPQSFDQRFLVLMAWGFMVPFVWGFSARWLPTFLGIRTPCNRGLMIVLALNFAGVTTALLGAFRAAVILLLAAAVLSNFALRIQSRSLQPAKTKGVHPAFPYFIRLAYLWLVVAAVLGVWAAFAANSDGIWGASRHALTVGFVSTMVFAVGQRILPAFSGMRLLYSPRLMGASLGVLTAGCMLRVFSEVLAYQGIWQGAWRVLPVSALTELTAVTLLTVNMVLTFRSQPPSARLVQLDRSIPPSGSAGNVVNL